MKDTITHLRELLSKANLTTLEAHYARDIDDGVSWEIHDEHGITRPYEEIDAALIVAAINALPALLNRLEQLEAMCVEMKHTMWPETKP